MPADEQMASVVIDQVYMAHLVEAIGIKDYVDIVKTLKEEVDLQISTLESCSQDCDMGGVKRSAHRLAGLLSQFGAIEVAEHAQQIRQTFASGEVSRMAASMAVLCRSSMAAIAELSLGKASLR